MGNLMRGGRGEWGVVVRLAGRRGTLANVQLHVVTINGGIDIQGGSGLFRTNPQPGERVWFSRLRRNVYVHNVTAEPPRRIRARTGVSKVPAFEVVLRRPNRKDRIRFWNRPDAQIGDIIEVDGRPWVIVEKEPPFELRRIERLICVPRLVRSMH